MAVVFSTKSLESIKKDFMSFRIVPEDPNDFINLVSAVGIKMIGKIDKEFLDNDDVIRKLIKTDTYCLFYLGERFHKDSYFQEVIKHHELLLMNPINKKLSNSTINWIIDNCPDYVRFGFFKQPYPQLNQEGSLLRQRLGLGFLIAGVEVPKYLQKDVKDFTGKSKEELLSIKTSILTYEKIEAMLTYEKLDVRIKKIKI